MFLKIPERSKSPNIYLFLGPASSIFVQMNYSVIIPSYQRPKMLERALLSVYKQTYSPDAVYLVIDEIANASIYAFLDNFDKRLNVTYTGGGFGGAKARNVGLEKATEDIVFFLDDDDEWLPEKAEKQIALLEDNPSLVAVTCACYMVSNNSRMLVRKRPEEVNRYVKVYNLTGGFSCFGFRRSGLLKKIRLDPDLPSAQDYEFYIRVSIFGKFGVVETPQVIFNVHQYARITNSTRNLRRNTLNRILKKNVALFSEREKMFYIAKMEIITAGDQVHFTKALYQFLYGVLNLIKARKYPKLGVIILFRGTRDLLVTFFKGLGFKR